MWFRGEYNGHGLWRYLRGCHWRSWRVVARGSSAVEPQLHKPSGELFKFGLSLNSDVDSFYLLSLREINNYCAAYAAERTKATVQHTEQITPERSSRG